MKIDTYLAALIPPNANLQSLSSFFPYNLLCLQEMV